MTSVKVSWNPSVETPEPAAAADLNHWSTICEAAWKDEAIVEYMRTVFEKVQTPDNWKRGFLVKFNESELTPNHVRPVWVSAAIVWFHGREPFFVRENGIVNIASTGYDC